MGNTVLAQLQSQQHKIYASAQKKLGPKTTKKLQQSVSRLEEDLNPLLSP